MVLTEGHLSPIFLDLRTYDEPKEMGVECGEGTCLLATHWGSAESSLCEWYVSECQVSGIDMGVDWAIGWVPCSLGQDPRAG